MIHERKTSADMPGVRTLSDNELETVTGGSMMDLVNKAFEDYLKNCLFKLTREGTVAVCPLPK
jgi:bacteriocin-like protein